MKVSELFEAFKSGAAYKPGYHEKWGEKSGVMLGSVKDWLDENGLTTKDMQEAMERVRATDLFHSLADAGLHYSPTPRREKFGTFNFKVERMEPAPGGKKWGTEYQVYANGIIRGTSTGGWNDKGHQHKLSSPKPYVTPGDPVGSLVKIYMASLEHLKKKWMASKASQLKAAEPHNYVRKYLGQALSASERRPGSTDRGQNRSGKPLKNLDKENVIKGMEALLHRNDYWGAIKMAVHLKDMGNSFPELDDLQKRAREGFVMHSLEISDLDKDTVIKGLLKSMHKHSAYGVSPGQVILVLKKLGYDYPEFAAMEKSIRATRAGSSS